jgi:hypothetical protein
MFLPNLNHSNLNSLEDLLILPNTFEVLREVQRILQERRFDIVGVNCPGLDIWDRKALQVPKQIRKVGKTMRI